MQTQNRDANASTVANGTLLISARSIQGTLVYSPTGDDLGRIDDVMIDTASGRTVYGILEFGGFLGLGGGHHAIPFAMLRYDGQRDGYVTDLCKEQREKAPTLDDDWGVSSDWQKRSDDFYGVTPYWL